MITACLIVRDSARTMEACLKSLKSGVDFINITDTGSVDDTKKIIKETLRGFPHKLTEFTWIDDFSAARNFNFAQAPAETEWLLWVDSDDTVEGAENIKNVLAAMPPDTGAVWLQYNYSQDEFGNCRTTFERERLLRAKYGWIWQSRVHETVQPIIPCAYYRDRRVVIKHNHTNELRSGRNFKLLNLMLKEEPENRRVWLYLGHQHFAESAFQEAVEWYLKFSQATNVQPIEKYQTLTYAARALRNLREYPQAISCDLTAMDIYPDWVDAFVGLAMSYSALGEWDKCISWGLQAKAKRLPDPMIFINPLESAFNVPAVLGEAYLRKKMYAESLREYEAAYAVRPVADVKYNIDALKDGMRREEAVRAIKVLAVSLLENKELVKVKALPQVVPFWFRETTDYAELVRGVEHYTAHVQDAPQIVEDGENGVIINIDNCLEPEKVLAAQDSKKGTVTVISSMPGASPDRCRVLSPSEMEVLVTSAPGRRLIDLHYEPDRIMCKYDHKEMDGLLVRIFCGEGLEHWSVKTIQEQGCGGSETWAAYMGMELAGKNCQSYVYAMDTQVFNGAIFRHHTHFRPDISPCHLFISSRVPDILHAPIAAKQKWLWCHDIHNGDRLTPEIAEKLDAIVCLSRWHAGHLKRCYPWLSECLIDAYEKDEPLYMDEITLGGPFYPGAKLFHRPRLAVIGNGIDPARFENLDLTQKKQFSFAWVSSPDRGLEQVLSMWPLILEAMPGATLNIYYGWEYFDSTLGIPGQAEFKAKIQSLLKQPGVTWKGRVGQVQLAQEIATTDAWLYPPNHAFRETFCISALEMQAANVICFYRQSGALGETIGEGCGVPLPLEQEPAETVAKICEVLTNPGISSKLRDNGRVHAMRRTWAAQAQKVFDLYKAIEQGAKQ